MTPRVGTAPRVAERPAGARRPPSGWHAYHPAAGALLPSWAVELALSIERPFTASGRLSVPRALLLTRAAGPLQPMTSALGAAMRELDWIAGTGSPLPRLGLVRSDPAPGLDALPRRVVHAHLRGAGLRGLPMVHRRRQTDKAGVAWQPGAGVVLTCTSRAGVSAQAVVRIAGRGALSPLRPPPGGATVLRAWRCHRPLSLRALLPQSETPSPLPGAEWALTTGVVLASSSSIGLGRVARRYAVLTQVAGWDATVLAGSAALALARCGDPRYPPPTTIARYASRKSVTDLLTACLEAAADRTGQLALPST